MKSKQFLMIFLVLTSGVHIQAAQQSTVVVQERAAVADVDSMLNDDSGLLDEPVHIKPISNKERWLRIIGSTILLNYLALKKYIAQTWQQLTQSGCA
jgi:hypothetical protein